MLRFLFYILCCLFFKGLNAQNLVPNPCFSDTAGKLCPHSSSLYLDDEVAIAKGWSSFGATPDYFNACGTKAWSEPTNALGYQIAACGDAYCGIITYYDSTQIKNYRELIGIQLITPLVTGKKYSASVKVCMADSVRYATNNIGISFSTVRYADSTSAPINNHAIVNDTSVITDTINWTTISGSFVADSDYTYVIVGNFFKDNSVKIVSILPSYKSPNSYYYVGFVSVTPDTTGTTIIDTITQTICQGQSYSGHDTTGKFTDTFTTTGGYDSVRVINLTLITPVINVSKQTICPGDSFAGHTTGGDYYDTIFSTGGCDSIITKLELDISPLLADTVFDTILKGQTYAGYDSAGIYVDTFTTTNGCDSIRTLLLTVKDTTTGITQPTSPITPHLIIYPNPASTSINVSATVPMDGFVVYNPEGQEIMRRDGIKTKQAIIDLQGWAKGVYILQATIGQQKLVKRFTVLE